MASSPQAYMAVASEKTLSEAETLQHSQQHPAHKYRIYPERYFVLVTVCLLALSNAMQWMAYTSLSQETSAYFCQPDVDCDIGYWTNQIFQMVGVFLGVLGMFITDRYGIRLSIRLGATCNFVGSAIRFLSAIPALPLSARSPILHIGSVITASSQAFFLVLSPKVAEIWFPENQRALANVVSFIANPLGVAVGTVIPAFVVHGQSVTKESYAFFAMNGVFFGLSLCVFVMALFVRHSAPPSPPSASNDNHDVPGFMHGLKILFVTPHFYVELVVFGMGFALGWSFFVVADEFCINLGYDESITSLLTPGSALLGVFSSIAAGAFVDRTKRFKETIRVCMLGFCVTAILLNFQLRHSYAHWGDSFVLLVLCCLIGFFTIPVFPIGIEMCIESTFPVQEATSSGLLVIGGQICMFLVVFAMNEAKGLKELIYSTAGTSFKFNYYLAVDVWCGFGVFAFLVSIIFMRPKYKRIEFEKACLLQQNTASDDDDNNQSISTGRV